MPPRPAANARAETAEAKLAPSTARLWVLRNGQPEALLVKTGLTDGRNTEISGEGITEGLAIILRANTPAS